MLNLPPVAAATRLLIRSAPPYSVSRLFGQLAAMRQLTAGRPPDCAPASAASNAAPAAVPIPALFRNSRLFMADPPRMESSPDYNSRSGAQSSVSGDGHFLDQDRAATARAACKHVVSDRHDGAEHLAQVASDGDFLHGVPDLAPLHPVARRAARVVAGDEIHPEPEIGRASCRERVWNRSADSRRRTKD